MKDPSINDVFYIDQLLHQLASYEVTRGLIVVPKSVEEAMELQQKTADKFNYFKTLIRKGECTIDFIKYQVLKKNGPYPQEKELSIDDPNLIDKIADWKQPSQSDVAPNDAEFIKSVIKLFGPDMSESEKNEFMNKMGIKSVKRYEADLLTPPTEIVPKIDPPKKIKTRKRKPRN